VVPVSHGAMGVTRMMYLMYRVLRWLTGLEVRLNNFPRGLVGTTPQVDTDSSQTRGSVPITARQSVHCVPVMDVALELNELEGYVKERFETRIALALKVYHSAAHGDVERAPQDEWSDRGLQVLDLKAAGALSCSCVVEAIRAGSHSIKLASPIMHHAPSCGRCRASVGRRQTDMNPSFPRVATLSDRCLTLLDNVLDHVSRAA